MKDMASLGEEIIGGNGYVVIPNVLSLAQAEEARSTVLQLVELDRQKEKLFIEDKRERLHNLIDKAEIFELMVQHPKIIEIAEAVLGEDMTLSGYSAHILNPGATSMGIHVDYPYWTMKLPFPSSPVMNVQIIWMVQDFTEDNGAPVFAPTTQKLCSPPDSKYFAKIARKVTGKAGSVILSHGLCWHDTSMNCSDKPRVSILANYTPKFVRPMTDVFSNMPSKFIDDASPKLKRLLGYEFKSDLFKDVKRLRSQGWN